MERLNRSLLPHWTRGSWRSLMSSRHVSSPHAGIGNPGMCTNCSTRDVFGERAVMEGDGGTSHVGHGVDEFKEREIGKEEEKRLFNSCLGSCSFSCLRNRLYIPSSPLYISIGSLRWRTSPTHVGVGTRHEAAFRCRKVQLPEGGRLMYSTYSSGGGHGTSSLFT